MAPDISRQFRGLENLLESQQRTERISFLGSDVSPVIQVDPPSFDLANLILSDIVVTGPAVNADDSVVPAGFFREVRKTSINHNDTVVGGLVNVEIFLIRASDGAFIIARSTLGTLLNNITQGVFGQDIQLIPPGWFLRIQFTGLAAPFIGRLKTLSVDRALGLTPNTR